MIKSSSPRSAAQLPFLQFPNRLSDFSFSNMQWHTKKGTDSANLCLSMLRACESNLWRIPPISSPYWMRQNWPRGDQVQIVACIWNNHSWRDSSPGLETSSGTKRVLCSVILFVSFFNPRPVSVDTKDEIYWLLFARELALQMIQFVTLDEDGNYSHAAHSNQVSPDWNDEASWNETENSNTLPGDWLLTPIEEKVAEKMASMHGLGKYCSIVIINYR